MSIGSISGEELDAMFGESVPPAVTSVTRRSAASPARPSGEISSELPSLSESGGAGVLVDVEGPSVVEDDVGRGWTPVTRRTSRTHREDSQSVRSEEHDSNASVPTSVEDKTVTASTVAQATEEMSQPQLVALARRHEAFAAQLRAKAIHMESVPPSTPRSDHHGVSPFNNGAVSVPVNSPKPESVEVPKVSGNEETHGTHRVTVEEVDDEDMPSSFIPPAGPSHNKGKGPDPRNWGDISSLNNFSEHDLQDQRDALLTWNTIRRIKQEEITPHLEFSKDISQRPSSPKAKKPRKRSKSPKTKQMSEEDVGGHPPANFVTESAPPKPIQHVQQNSKPVENIQPSENERRVEIIPPADNRDVDNDRGKTSGRTIDEVYNLLIIGKMEEERERKHLPLVRVKLATQKSAAELFPVK
ncbi:hypothetical protein R3P38DRAFT_3514146 [Favolaschia claudopus]|uniref:Uncharacterized protein n=1 Tax=Favolaschia claudopus TaxID=2862362 RepID=A0AAW0BUK4_9AGAR